jgi:hypothetical protein
MGPRSLAPSTRRRRDRPYNSSVTRVKEHNLSWLARCSPPRRGDIRAASPVGLSSSTSRRWVSTGSIMWRLWRLAPASCPSIGATRQRAIRRRSPPRCHRRSACGPARRPCGRLLPSDSASRRCGRCGTRRPRPRRERGLVVDEGVDQAAPDRVDHLGEDVV